MTTTQSPPGALPRPREPREATTGLDRYRAAVARLDCAAAHVATADQDTVYDNLAAHLDAVVALVPVQRDRGAQR